MKKIFLLRLLESKLNKPNIHNRNHTLISANRPTSIITKDHPKPETSRKAHPITSTTRNPTKTLTSPPPAVQIIRATSSPKCPKAPFNWTVCQLLFTEPRRLSLSKVTSRMCLALPMVYHALTRDPESPHRRGWWRIVRRGVTGESWRWDKGTSVDVWCPNRTESSELKAFKGFWHAATRSGVVPSVREKVRLFQCGGVRVRFLGCLAVSSFYGGRKCFRTNVEL